jgi:hypothetical protein
MSKTRESPHTALAALTAEMMRPPIAASAQVAMRPETEGTERKLVLVNEDPFQGYACSWCGCRFPDDGVPSSAHQVFRSRAKHRVHFVTLGEKLLPFEAQRQKRFAEHVCSDRPHVTH